jgi:hypothetical protein
MQACKRPVEGIVLGLLVGCTPPPPEVTDSGHGSDPAGTTSETSPGPTGGAATADTGDGSATTLAMEGTTAPSSTSEPGEGTSTDGGMDESSGASTTGEPGECHPILAEVLYNPTGSDNKKEWIRLYNPCAVEIELDLYSLGWGGTSYVATGRKNLEGAVDPGECFLVGGATSDGSNGNPVYDQESDFNGDLQNGGDPADGVALFLGKPGSITAGTVPLDAVIYGDTNGSGLLDANGDMPPPHVATAPEGSSIRRTALTPTWVIEPNPTPNACPVL